MRRASSSTQRGDSSRRSSDGFTTRGVIGPGLGEHLGIVHGRLPHQIVAVSPEALGHVHVVAVEIAALAEPRVLDEVRRRRPPACRLPSGRRNRHRRRIGVGAMRPSVGGDHAIGVARNVFVEEDDLVRQLHDLARRSDARHARLARSRTPVGFAFVVEQILHLGLKLGLVGRSRRERQRALHVALRAAFCPLKSVCLTDRRPITAP